MVDTCLYRLLWRTPSHAYKQIETDQSDFG
jgi:hypothetical protein